ncbi:MAG TPA: hypothetical protein VD962_07640, partial [Rubricoccaceae bacterium]|nr:hypothetical protein [Rubricoccaceae bacterium]
MEDSLWAETSVLTTHTSAVSLGGDYALVGSATRHGSFREDAHVYRRTEASEWEADAVLQEPPDPGEPGPHTLDEFGVAVGVLALPSGDTMALVGTRRMRPGFPQEPPLPGVVFL